MDNRNNTEIQWPSIHRKSLRVAYNFDKYCQSREYGNILFSMIAALFAIMGAGMATALIAEFTLPIVITVILVGIFTVLTVISFVVMSLLFKHFLNSGSCSYYYYGFYGIVSFFHHWTSILAGGPPVEVVHRATIIHRFE